MYFFINIILVASPCIMLNAILSSEFWALSFVQAILAVQYNRDSVPHMTFVFHIQLVILYSRADNFNPTISVKCIMQHIAVYFCGDFIPKYAGPLFNI